MIGNGWRCNDGYATSVTPKPCNGHGTGSSNRYAPPDRDTVFYVGNQAKRQQTFMMLAAFYPKH
jgi:hypothetical protein